jgi:hypothetical protein
MMGILAIPTVPGSPKKLRMEVVALESFRARAFSLLSTIWVLSGIKLLNFEWISDTSTCPFF